LQSLQPVCKLSGPLWDTFADCPDPLANAEVQELTFATSPDPLANVEVRELTFATRPDPIEDARDLKCACPNPHLARSVPEINARMSLFESFLPIFFHFFTVFLGFSPKTLDPCKSKLPTSNLTPEM
jgi:hypothetical protein